MEKQVYGNPESSSGGITFEEWFKSCVNNKYLSGLNEMIESKYHDDPADNDSIMIEKMYAAYVFEP